MEEPVTALWMVLLMAPALGSLAFALRRGGKLKRHARELGFQHLRRVTGSEIGNSRGEDVRLLGTYAGWDFELHLRSGELAVFGLLEQPQHARAVHETLSLAALMRCLDLPEPTGAVRVRFHALDLLNAATAFVGGEGADEVDFEFPTSPWYADIFCQHHEIRVVAERPETALEAVPGLAKLWNVLQLHWPSVARTTMEEQFARASHPMARAWLLLLLWHLDRDLSLLAPRVAQLSSDPGAAGEFARAMAQGEAQLWPAIATASWAPAPLRLEALRWIRAHAPEHARAAVVAALKSDIFGLRAEAIALFGERGDGSWLEGLFSSRSEWSSEERGEWLRTLERAGQSWGAALLIALETYSEQSAFDSLIEDVGRRARAWAMAPVAALMSKAEPGSPQRVVLAEAHRRLLARFGPPVGSLAVSDTGAAGALGVASEGGALSEPEA